MQTGSIVECVMDASELGKVWDIKYPEKGDILTVATIRLHHIKTDSYKDIHLLTFEERPDLPEISDKQVDDTDNFIELLLWRYLQKNSLNLLII